MFMLFAGHYYYPSGGFHDFKGLFPTLEAAQGAAGEYDWAHVVVGISMVWFKSN